MIHRAPLSLLYLNVLAIATCGLIYELLAGTLASYLLGDSVTQFSLVIGVYLSAMGAGAWIAQYIERHLARVFIEIELALALIGGFSTILLFVAFPFLDGFRFVLFGSVTLIGILVGLELPLLMRILKEHLDFSELVSRVLAFDYLGALFASVLFPIVLVPRVGLTRTALIFGLLNAAVGLWGTYLLRPLLSERGLQGLRGRAVLTIGLLVIGLIKAEDLTTLAEENMLGGKIVYAAQSPFQRIAVTSNQQSFQLYLNGHLQFNSIDEYRYHEALVHPAMASIEHCENVLVLGGGDGLAVRELLRYEAVRRITLVDLDPAMTRLATDFAPLADLNRHAMTAQRVRVIHRDAFLWVDEDDERFDAVIIDFPDPGNYSIGKLYSTRFFQSLRKRVAADGVVAVQCTSPLVAPRSYWCILNTLRASGMDVMAYHAPVPTFGVWGFALAKHTDTMSPTSALCPPTRLAAGVTDLRYLTDASLRGLFDLPADQQPLDVPPNRLNDQVLVRLYEQEWSGRGG